MFPNPAAETANDALRHQQFWYGTWTHIFTPALLNEFRFTYERRTNFVTSGGLGGDWPSQLGLTGLPNNAFPQFKAAGFVNLGAATQERQQLPIEQYDIVSNTSWIHGRHSLKFGAEIRPSMNHEIFQPSISGSFAFSRGFTGQPGNANTGSGFATLLLGTPTNVQQQQTPLLYRKAWYLAGFV